MLTFAVKSNMTIVCDTLKKKWKELQDKNQSRQQDEVYERKRRKLVDNGLNTLDQDVEKLKKDIEELKKVNK